jgi:hypothetical protein
MDHAAFIIFILARLSTLERAEGQSNQWYNWFEDNAGKRLIENGILPTLSCPFGHYRKFKGAPHEPGGINLDGCLKCPQGVFGNTTDLTSPNCTAPCPLGTFSDEEGLESIEGCKKCPAGTYGDKEGLKTPACSGSCVDLNRLEFNELYFSMDTGLISSERKLNMKHSRRL